jgi:hypothetical protein
LGLKQPVCYRFATNALNAPVYGSLPGFVNARRLRLFACAFAGPR